MNVRAGPGGRQRRQQLPALRRPRQPFRRAQPQRDSAVRQAPPLCSAPAATRLPAPIPPPRKNGNRSRRRESKPCRKTATQPSSPDPRKPTPTSPSTATPRPESTTRVSGTDDPTPGVDDPVSGTGDPVPGTCPALVSRFAIAIRPSLFYPFWRSLVSSQNTGSQTVAATRRPSASAAHTVSPLRANPFSNIASATERPTFALI